LPIVLSVDRVANLPVEGFTNLSSCTYFL